MKRVLSALLGAVVAVSLLAPAASASWGLEQTCAARGKYKVYYRAYCSYQSMQFLTKINSENYIGVKAGHDMAHRRVSLWMKSPGRDWRWTFSTTLDRYGRARRMWQAPSAPTRFENDYMFQWRSPYRDYRSPKVAVVVLVPCDPDVCGDY